MTDLHKNGPCKVRDNSIYGFCDNLIENPAVIIDMPDNDDDVITMHKYGSKSGITDVFNNMREKFAAIGATDMADSLQLISFNVQTGFADYDAMSQAKFTPDEICTLINWLCNAIPKKNFTELLTGNEAAMHEKLKTLAEIGF